MGKYLGKLEARGPFIEIKVMATRQRVEVLKSLNLPYPGPATIRALIDTGASSSALDEGIVGRLKLTPTGSVSVHTPSTGPTHDTCDQYDVTVVLGENAPDPKTFTVGVLGSRFASEGFFALIGWDILSQCILTCDGPSRSFSLEY